MIMDVPTLCRLLPRAGQVPLFSAAASRFPRLLTPLTLVRATPPPSIASALSPPRRDFRGSFSCDTSYARHLNISPAYAQYTLALKPLVLIQDRPPPLLHASCAVSPSTSVHHLYSPPSGSFWCSDALLPFKYFAHLSTRCISSLPTASSRLPRLPPHAARPHLAASFFLPRCGACALNAPSFPPPHHSPSITTPPMRNFCASSCSSDAKVEYFLHPSTPLVLVLVHDHPSLLHALLSCPSLPRALPPPMHTTLGAHSDALPPACRTFAPPSSILNKICVLTTLARGHSLHRCGTFAARLPAIRTPQVEYFAHLLSILNKIYPHPHTHPLPPAPRSAHALHASLITPPAVGRACSHLITLHPLNSTLSCRCSLISALDIPLTLADAIQSPPYIKPI
ncbi:hypothetical protein C8J57DRAFT_1658245 [Mycena rebaudengoi]|nr:hypothetical protein C8J57DRAFT_1658245 [Mycena rebaudengoi]